MHWVQSPRNSHFTVSTLTIPHTFHGEPLPFSHSLFLWANFNWLAGLESGCSWHLGQLMGQSCVAAVLFIHEASVALKVIQLEDIIPRYLATCVSPVHVAGRTTAVHYTPSLCCVSAVWPSTWQGVSISPKCWDGRQQRGLHSATQVSVQTVLSIF